MDITSTRIKELRIENGYTQQQVADYLKIDRSNYSKYERGFFEVSLDMLRGLSRLYNVTSDYLLGLTNDYSLREN